MRWAWAVAASMLVPLLAGCTGSSSFETIPDPGWKAGYTFGHELVAEGTFKSTLRTADGDVLEDDEESDDSDPVLFVLKVANSAFESPEGPLYLAVMTGDNFRVGASNMGDVRMDSGPAGAALIGIRPRDLQPMRTEVQAQRGCLTCPIESATIRFSADNDDYSWIRFPLVHKDSWAGKVPFDEFVGAIDVESEVRGLVSIDGPGGPVDAVHVHHVLENKDLEEQKDKVIAGARREGVDVRKLDIELSSTVDVHFAPSLHAIVSEERRLDLKLHAEFSYDGEDLIGDLEGHAVLRTRLVSYDLTEGPELDLKQAVAALSTPPELPPIPDDGGTPPTAGAGALRLTVDQANVNAAETPTVRFTTTATGTGRVTSYQVVDAAGTLVAGGSGGDFELVVDEPGVYTATVTGVDGDGRRLQAGATVEARYEVTLDAGCAPASVTDIPGCAEVAFPVNPGLIVIDVAAVRAPLAPTPGLGTLVLEGPAGEREEAMMTGNEARITIPAPQASGEWKLRYEPTLGVLEDVSYDIRVTFATSAGATAWTALAASARSTAEALAAPKPFFALA
jgi:hypothetical protein